MVGIKNNRRAQYTRKIIKETVLSLLQKESIDSITVTEICKAADVNRITFYRYYDDVYSCVDSIETDFLDNLKIPQGTSMIDGLKIMLGEFYKNPALSNLVFVEGKTKLLDRMSHFHDHAELVKTTMDEYEATYIMLGVQGIMKRWVKNGMKESPEMLTNIIVKVVFAEELQDKKALFDLHEVKEEQTDFSEA